MGKLASLGSRLFGVFVVLVVGLGAQEAWARSAGIASSEFVNRTPPSCNACHSMPGTALPPLVMLTADDTTLSAGQQITLTFVVTRQTTGQTAAGFNIRASMPGTFAVGGADSAMTQAIVGNAEVTHTGRKPVTGETTTFTALWTPASGTVGTVTFTAWGNSVNQAGGNTGDAAAGTTLDVTVACAPTAWFADADGDTFGNAGALTTACTQPDGHVASNTDCDDSDPAIKPGATEVCNGADDNCTAGIDEGFPTMTFYTDADADTFGSHTAATKTACSLAAAGAGFADDNTDCNDGNAAIKPGATEVCNGMDDNCAGGTDEGLATMTFYTDADGDTFGSPSAATKDACSLAVAGAAFSASNTDCNDGNAAIKPGGTEICNGMDDNCAGGTDEGLAPLTCGTGACMITVAACVAGVPQLCTPVCPPDAGLDASADVMDTGVEAVTDVVGAEPPKPVDMAPPPVDTGAGADVSHMDATPTVDAGAGAADVPHPADATGSDVRDGNKSDGVLVAGDDGCDCRIGGANRGGLAPGVLLLVLGALVLRRRRPPMA